MEEEKLEKIINKIDGIGDNVDNLGVLMNGVENKVDNLGVLMNGVENKVDNLGVRMNGVENKVDNLGVRMEKTEKQVDTIAVAVVEMQEQLKNVPTRDEINLRFHEASVNVDRFTKLHETLDQELVMMRSKYSRLEERVQMLEQKAFAGA